MNRRGFSNISISFMKAPREDIAEIISDRLDLELTEVYSLNRLSCAKWDSLKHAEIVIELQRKFDIEFATDQLEALNCVDSIFVLMNSRLPK